MKLVHLSLHEARLARIEQARKLFMLKNMTATELAQETGSSYESARGYIRALMADGEIRSLTTKKQRNSLITSVYGFIGAPDETRAVKAKEVRPLRFNPSQWCVEVAT